MISTGRMKQLSSLTWWQQSVLISLSYILLSAFSVLFIAPTGPGSERILFVVLLAYSCLLVLLNSKTARLLGLVVGITAVVGIIKATKAKNDFARAMQERIQLQRVDRSAESQPPQD